MPNHVKNVLTFRNLKSEDKRFILDTIASAKEEGGHRIDFDKIIPEPRTKEECPEDCIVNKDSHVSPIEEKPWFDWYAWRNKYWGTKWGAYDCYTTTTDTTVIFIFETAWSLAYPVITKLPLLGYKFDIRWADEDWGSNCGKITFSREQGWQEAWEEAAYKNPRQFAERLWNKY